MSIKKIVSLSPVRTKKIGKSLALEIIGRGQAKSAILVFLEGDLGGGKTTFVQGFADGLGIKEAILSPTFILFRKFQIPKCQNVKMSKYQNFYHLDCYRIKNSKEILALGFKDIVASPENIVCLEWPERIKRILPKPAAIVEFNFLSKNRREIAIVKTPDFW